jgi:DNA topoisomerase-1
MASGYSRSTLNRVERLGLQLAKPEEFTLRRVRRGRGFAYLDLRARPIRDRATLTRIRALAVPPAYRSVRFANDPAAHLQAVARDSAGRLQYRYHPKWQDVRDLRKAKRLYRLLTTMPKLRRGLSRHLSVAEPTRDHVLAAIVELVAVAGIRAGSQRYARDHGTRGATTLLKSDVQITGTSVTLRFKGKLGKLIEKRLHSVTLARSLKRLMRLPGRGLFQYRDDNGNVRSVRRQDVNNFLRDLAGANVSLKDFRTLVATELAFKRFTKASDGCNLTQRKRTVLAAVEAVAGELGNTPTICRKSYVHQVVLSAYQNGSLDRLVDRVGAGASRRHRERSLAQLLRFAGAHH